MKKNKVLLLFPCILFLFSACSGVCKVYGRPSTGYTEGPTNPGHIQTFVHFSRSEINILPFYYLQPVLPLPYENYRIWFSVSNKNDILKETNDIMRSMYIDEFRIVLPSGRVIDLLDGKINIIYHYNGSEEITGMLYKEVKNFKPQYIDGVKRLIFDGIKNGDGISIDFYTRIPAYSVDSVRLEYTLNIEWENRGTVRRRSIGIFNKELRKWYAFTV
jgi:hypothetical protein